MKRIPRLDYLMLKKMGLLKDRTKTREPNYIVLNKKHSASAKSVWVVETPDIIKALKKINNMKRIEGI